MLFSLTGYSQWFDSVKHVAATQKNDTSKVQTLIHLSDAYAFSYPDTAFFMGSKLMHFPKSWIMITADSIHSLASTLHYFQWATIHWNWIMLLNCFHWQKE
jgi:hypothetical protein